MTSFGNAPKRTAIMLLAVAGLFLSAAAMAGDMARFKGDLMVPDSADLPDGATAKVMLVEISGDYQDPSPIATKDLGDISGHTVPFEIAVEHGKLEDGSQYALRAKIMDGSGNVAWTSGEIWPVEPMQGAVTAYLSMTEVKGNV